MHLLDGWKIHTIRDDKGGRWKEGTKINFATGAGQRKENYNQFKVGECISVQDIKMRLLRPIPFFERRVEIFVDGDRLTGSQVVQLALNSGFDSVFDFTEHFRPKINRLVQKEYRGTIIHWTSQEYGS